MTADAIARVLELHLTIPDQATAWEAVRKASGSNGQDTEARHLATHPLARSERGRPRRMDHVHLSRIDGTDYVLWYGRCPDGWHRPIGRVMQIVRADPDDRRAQRERHAALAREIGERMSRSPIGEEIARAILEDRA